MPFAKSKPGRNPLQRLSDQRRSLCPRKLGTLGNKEIEADIAVRLDGKLSDITQD